jgi:phosphoglycerol geranylgeranyltransferase
MIYESIIKYRDSKKLAVLIDPDKSDPSSLAKTIEICNKCKVDFLLVGGSFISNPVEGLVEYIKKNTSIPVILFPGSVLQISNKADAILLLSLISGRNPEYLIGNHVIAAPILKNSNLEIISVGYILVESGRITSVQYVSNTIPIPADKTDMAIATAIAGEMLGLKAIYLEAGSGALNHVPELMISEVRKNISVPIIVGGGLRSKEQVRKVFEAGADIVVIGNSLENNPENLFHLLTL